jgi:hypothetical protein
VRKREMGELTRCRHVDGFVGANGLIGMSAPAKLGVLPFGGFFVDLFAVIRVE